DAAYHFDPLWPVHPADEPADPAGRLLRRRNDHGRPSRAPGGIREQGAGARLHRAVRHREHPADRLGTGARGPDVAGSLGRPIEPTGVPVVATSPSDASNSRPASSGAGWLTLGIAGLTLVVLAFSVPGALRDAWDRGGFYLFSRAFLEDIPKRLTGPGRFRFIFQPLVATILGIRGGVADARAGRPPYLKRLLSDREHRRELAREGFS